jgi:hypothetical protein
MKIVYAKVGFVLLLIIVGCVTSCSSIQDVVATPSLSPQSNIAKLDLLSVEFNTEPTLIEPSKPVTVFVSIAANTNLECYGIPQVPLDGFLVVDNSLDSQYGTQGWGELQKLVEGFLSHTYPDAPVDQSGHASRYSLIDAEMSGRVVSQQKVAFEVPENIKERVSSVQAVSNKLDIENALQMAFDMWSANQRLDAQPVVVIFLREKSTIDQNVISKINSIISAGFDVFIIVNQAGTPPELQILSSDLDSWILENRFYVNPEERDLRKIFVSLSQGNTDWLAQEISLGIVTIPPNALEAFKIGSEVMVVGGGLVWDKKYISQDQQPHLLKYQARANPSLKPGDTIFVNLNLEYTDCNGFAQSSVQSIPISVQTERSESTPESVPDLPDIPDLPDAPDPNSTPTPDFVTPETIGETPETPNSSDISEMPDIPNVPDVFDFPEIPSISPAIPGALPAIMPILEWVGIILLLLLLIWVIWKLFKWFRRQETEELPAIAPEPPTVLDATPTWFKELRSIKRNKDDE